MLSFEPSVIVIDDQPDEVQGIIKYYRDQGIGCKYFNARQDSEDNYPEKTFSDVGLVFLDLYYTQSLNVFDAELCVSWIVTTIPKKSFYILIVWTREIEHRQEIIELLKREERLPFVCIIHNKGDFPSSNPELEKYDFTGLLNEINLVLENTPSLSEIGIWRKNIKSASNRVVGGLTKDHNPELFKTKLQKIIVSHGGTSIVSCKDDFRKRTILFEALDHILTSNTGSTIFKEEIDQINKEQLYNLPEEFRIPIDKELNSWFHFKLEKSLSAEIVPGQICNFQDGRWKDLYSIENDERIEKLLNRQKGDRVNIRSIALLLTRPCDIAQKKYGKNLQLLSGVKILNPIRKDNPREEFHKGEKEADSVIIFDHLYLSEEESDVTLLFDFRYIFSVPEQVFIENFENIKIFNKELLSDIQVKYSSYSSRLGITQII